MPGADFEPVVIAPMCFYSRTIDVALLVHGDDFLAEGRAATLSQVGDYLTDKFRINLVALAGPDQKTKDLKILKRTLSCSEFGWTWQGDERHVKDPVRELGLEKAKPAGTPGSKATAGNLATAEDEIDADRAARFKRLAGKLLYHSLDDPRVQFETGMVMRGMSCPRELDEARLFRVIRYLVGVPVVGWLFGGNRVMCECMGLLMRITPAMKKHGDP